MNKTLIIIQSRLNSSRFPRKALHKITGKPLIIRVIERMLSLEGFEKHVILAIPADDWREYINVIADAIKNGFRFEPNEFNIFPHAGDENNVLGRFKNCVSKSYSSVIRVTGDNPLISRTGLTELQKKFERGNYKLGYQTNYIPGTAVEIFKPEALLNIDETRLSDYEREHVTPYLYRTIPYNDRCIIENKSKWTYLCTNFSIDTLQDAIFWEDIFKENDMPSIKSAIEFINRRTK